jgi:hypothetical protein
MRRVAVTVVVKTLPWRRQMGPSSRCRVWKLVLPMAAVYNSYTRGRFAHVELTWPFSALFELGAEQGDARFCSQ